MTDEKAKLLVDYLFPFHANRPLDPSTIVTMTLLFTDALCAQCPEIPADDLVRIEIAAGLVQAVEHKLLHGS